MRGLCDQIKSAGTPGAIDILVWEGKHTFHAASDQTRRRWERLAERRKRQIAEPPKPVAAKK